jgi:glycyl-tRNA synthetase beta chain
MTSFLLEVGTEELPASFVSSALQQWQTLIPESLKTHLLAAESVVVMATPRRLAVLVNGLPERQPDQEEEIKGPSAQAAFKNGKPTPAAVGFARSKQVDVADFEIRATDKGEFIFVTQKITGRPTAEVLAELIPSWINTLEGKRFMRWGNGDLRFSRPIRWLVALLDKQILPVTIQNAETLISSDRISQGHRVLHPAPVSIPEATAYVPTLATAFVEVDPQRRQQQIRAQVEAAAATVGGRADIPADLLEEVTHLVEYPTAVVGQFEPEFLKLPVDVVTTVMVTHQRYFPIFATNKKAGSKAATNGTAPLLPNFITISNGDPAKADLIAAGNGRVIRARLADGQFFYQADQAMPLADYLPKLEAVTFQAKLGSMAAKVARIGKNVDLIAQQLQLESDSQKLCQRAAQLCKADLVTQMVGEFPELQGVMGQYYAQHSQEPEPIATAIYEHYLPRGAGDVLPQSLTGQVVGLADRFDTLVSIFGLGMIPTGSSDPFALRRAANAIINIIWAAKLPLNLAELLQQMTVNFAQVYDAAPVPATLEQQLRDFFGQRLRSLWQEEQGLDYDLVNAVLGEDDPDALQRVLTDVLDAGNRAQFLQACRQDGALDQIYETVNRATRLARQGDLDLMTLDPKTVIQADLLEQAAEKAFFDALNTLLPQTIAARSQRDYRQLVSALANIAPTVSRFFDGPDSVLVMAEEAEVRRNRLNLLALLRNHARILADFGSIVKS